jgi:2-keto-4-pentenoate hydratase/2-oxohepta-3-ene-1,7-dioic acid hydratase in catechol pathway
MLFYKWIDQKKFNIPIGKIICLARTYKKHALELDSNIPKSPIIFLKPRSSIIFSGDSIIYPSQSNCLHHEVELGVVIGKNGKNVLEKDCWDHIIGYCVGIDVTARDLQQKAKKQGLPWTISKGFDTFAPISNIIVKNKIKNPHNLNLELYVNNELRQKESTSKMMWSVPQLISLISSIMILERGDLILTGTPNGVSEIFRGDIIDAKMDPYCSLHVEVK